MNGRTVVVMPGDGIGRIVLPEALRVLAAAGFEATFVEAAIGWECWVREGNPLPERTVELLARHKLGLLGAITSKPNRVAEAELSPALRGTGLRYSSPILGLRKRLDQAICVRPCATFPGNPLNFVRRGPDGGIEEPVLDITVFRQNTEGLYAGVEWSDPPPSVRAAMASHPAWAPFADVPGRDLALTVRIVTREASRRIVEAAFRHARASGRPSVTLVEKPNVLRETSGLIEEVANDVAASYPEVAFESVNVDAVLAWLTRTPERFSVIVASNLFGDILSDAFAGLVGGLGFACSANLGPEVAVFEPTHGSAPRHAALDPPIVNPIAAILAGAMLAEHAGDGGAAARIRRAVGAVIAEGKVRTYDMLRIPGSAESIARGAASTPAMTDAVLAAL